MTTAPRYARGSIIRTDRAPGARRWEVLEVLSTCYRVRALYTPVGEPCTGRWLFASCEAATVLEREFPPDHDGVFDDEGIGHFIRE